MWPSAPPSPPCRAPTAPAGWQQRAVTVRASRPGQQQRLQAGPGRPLQQQQQQQQHGAETTNSSGEPAAAVQLLERPYQQQPVPDSTPLPVPDPPTAAGSRQPSAKTPSPAARPPSPIANPRRTPAAAGNRPLIKVPLRSALPVLRTLRFAERRLEADVWTVATTVLVAVGYIIWDRGVEELLDNIFGEGPKGSLFCILLGLGLVTFVRLVAGSRISKIFSL